MLHSNNISITLENNGKHKSNMTTENNAKYSSNNYINHNRK